MIPPGGGLTELQHQLLLQINEVQGMKSYATFHKIQKTQFKHLQELGVIGVATLTPAMWSAPGLKTFDDKAPSVFKHSPIYAVWLTQLGIDWLNGQVPFVQKYCTLDGQFFWRYQVCKRHKRRHTEEEWDESR